MSDTMLTESESNGAGSKITKGTLYLIPASLGGDNLDLQIPSGNNTVINKLDEFIVENERTARRFLRKSGFKGDFDLVTFKILDEHTPVNTIPELLVSVDSGKSIGLLSEAGYPCIADPGNNLVLCAHQKEIKVVPLVGPSSILMALVSSGFNGQSFVFHGYLPREKGPLVKSLKKIESDAIRNNQTQIFMETPYRNNSLLNEILTTCAEETLLCIASNITCDDEFIKTMNIRAWKKNMPDLHKKPGIFLIFRH